MRTLRGNQRYSVAVAGLSGALAGVLARLIEFPRWTQQDLQANGEWLLATHDAYFWVAGAERLNASAETMPMAILLERLSRILSQSPADLAFWISILLPCLAALPLALWANHLGSSRAAWVIPVLGTIAPAYYLRTRLGYYDTDWANLFFPLLIGWLLAVWLRRRLSHPENLSQSAQKSSYSSWPLPAALVILISLAIPWHTAIGLYVIGALGTAGLLIARYGRAELRFGSQLTLTAIALALLNSWLGVSLAIFLILLIAHFRRKVATQFWANLVFGVLMVLLFVVFSMQFQDYVSGVIPTYARNGSSGSSGRMSGGDLVFPSLATSVKETQELGLSATLGLAAFHPLLGAAGALGYLHLLRKNPTLLVLLPLLILGLASIWMGMRFAMFASPILLLGLVVPLERMSEPAVQWIERVKWGRVLASAVLVIGLAGLAYAVAGRQPAEPVIGKQHAHTLSRLGEVADSGGTIWTWWDYGYASQHFAHLGTFADGRRNSGEYLFSLGFVLGSQSIDRSVEFMLFSARNDNLPWTAWDGWPGSELQAWFSDLGELQPSNYSSPFPQYLIVQWEALPILPWINYYGSWDFQKQDGVHSQVLRIEQPFRLDLARGVIQPHDEAPRRVASVDVLDKDASRHIEYPQSSDAPHLLLNRVNGSAMLLDNLAYGSTLVQLLISSEHQLEMKTGLELVIDDGPFVRVFRLD